MSDFFVGEIRMFGFAWAPVDWALCNGAPMQVRQSQALFALLGNTYGGDGINTFNLPDLRGRTPIDKGAGPNLSPYAWGAKTGVETVALAGNQMPAHNHAAQGVAAVGTTAAIPGNYLSSTRPDASGAANPIYAAPQSLQAINPDTVDNAGGGQGHNNMQPYTVVNFCIATVGLFPPRQ